MEKVLAKYKCEGMPEHLRSTQQWLSRSLLALQLKGRRGRNTQGEGFAQRCLQMPMKWLFQSNGICQKQQSQATQHCGWEIVPWPLPRELVQTEPAARHGDYLQR